MLIEYSYVYSVYNKLCMSNEERNAAHGLRAYILCDLLFNWFFVRELSILIKLEVINGILMGWLKVR